MKLDRVLAIARKNLRALKHDRRTVGFLVLMPLLMITIFGYTFGGDVKNLGVCIVNLDSAPANESVAMTIINDLLTRETLEVKTTYGPQDLALDPVALATQKVRDADIWAVIVFGPNFTEDVQSAVGAMKNGSFAMPGSFTVIIDGTNPNIVSAILNDLQESIQHVLVSPSYRVVPPISVAPDLVYGKGARFIDFFAPGVMGLAAMMVTFMLSIISFVHERSGSTLDRLLSTPATEGEIVAGYALAFGFVALIQSIVILVAAIGLFQITIHGNVLLVLLMIFVFGVGSQGLGFVLSSVARTEFQAIQFLPLILFPSILLSGVFWPLEAVPPVLRPISYFIPLTYAVDGLRSVMIRGWGVDGIWLPLAVLVAFAVVMLLLSTWALKRRR
jgi:ABC-2 type transport system permease protein